MAATTASGSLPRRASGNRHHLSSEELHPEHVGRLPRDICRAHEDHAGQAKPCADRCRRHPVLARAGLGDDPGLTHPHREQDLPDAIVDLVRAGVVELVALEPDLRAAKHFCQSGRKIERARASDVMFEQVIEFGFERRVRLGSGVLAL